MKMYTLFVFLLVSSSVQKSALAEELGRFFLTEKQRQQLEYLRKKESMKVVEKDEPEVIEEIIVTEELMPEAEFEKEPLIQEPIRLKGVVYRGKSGNTAWLNEENTYEGGLAPMNVSVSESQIGQDEVLIQLPDNVTEITLKVGQSWQEEPATSGEVVDN